MLRSGELAGLAGVSADTVRHYERTGVLPPAVRTDAGYRLCPQDSIQRVLLIRSAIQAGFSLKELARVLRVRDAGGAPCHEVHALAKSKLARVREQIASLQLLEKLLRERLASWNRRLARTPTGSPARLLDDLAEAFAHSKMKRGNK
jgi:DNA-binding transcriptional MerR regulator